MCKTRFECPVCDYKWSRENAPGSDIATAQQEPVAAYCSEDCERESFVPANQSES